MKRFAGFLIIYFIMLTVSAMTVVSAAAPPSKQDVTEAMRKAADFMVNEVSYRGGYLWYYSEDLSERWGEAPARPTQIWVQGSTCEVGEMFLEAYDVTGDRYWLSCAEKAADALIYGQHPLGGWHYFVEFDKPGLAGWYKKVFSRFKWGMEEYRHYYGNCTYDDITTQGATRFLLRLYMANLDPAFRTPLLKALDFLLMSQYPNGAWPQRYPLRYEFAHDGLADYTSYYTMNDNSMRDILNVLVEAWEKLGDERYLEAALRGADWMIAAQGPAGQAGWAEQYDMEMNPAWARTHEPAGYMPRQSVQVIRQLMDFYLMTGDRRYLSPIPLAIKWLEDSTIEIQADGRHNLARYYEPGTNEPVYQHRTDRVNEEGYGLYYYDNDPTGVSGGWVFNIVDVKALKRDYDRVSALSPEQARAEYEKRRIGRRDRSGADPEAVAGIISSMNERGAWIGEIRVYDVTKTMTDDPHKTIQGIATGTFLRNMETMIGYLRGME